MGYLPEEQLRTLGFASLGRNVLISERCSLYGPEKMHIGDNSRVDDYCVLSGAITLGHNVHVAVHSILEGGDAGITLNDYAGLAYGCVLTAQTDDYSGLWMTNPTVPTEFSNVTGQSIVLGRHVILGTRTTVLPGVIIGEGSASGAGTLFTHSAEAWTIFVGQPARKLRDRNRTLESLAVKHESTLPDAF